VNKKILLGSLIVVGSLFYGISFSSKAEEVTLEPLPAEIAQNPILAEEANTQPQSTISADGVYVLKQGVSEDLDISTSTDNSYWTQVDTSADITFSDDGSLTVVKDDQHIAADVTVNEEEFIKALNQAVTGDPEDDTYTWKYNKVILENNGYHLDCIAYVPEYIVTYITGDNNDIKVTVLRNDTTSGIDYSRDGYELVGYYTDEEFLNSYDFDTKVKESFNIYLSWLKITADEELPATKPVIDNSSTSIVSTTKQSQTQESAAALAKEISASTENIKAEKAESDTTAQESIVLGEIRELENNNATPEKETPAITGRGAILTGDNLCKIYLWDCLTVISALLCFTYFYLNKRV
jgi:hypothetical protein